MLTYYKNTVFLAKSEGDKVIIWRYRYFPDFKEKGIGNGRHAYLKVVDKKNVSDFFDVRFYVIHDNKKFFVNRYSGDDIYVFCDDRVYAEKNGFTETDRGVWIASKPIGLFDRIQMLTFFIDSDVEKDETIGINEFKDLWNKYVIEVG